MILSLPVSSSEHSFTQTESSSLRATERAFFISRVVVVVVRRDVSCVLSFVSCTHSTHTEEEELEIERSHGENTKSFEVGGLRVRNTKRID